MGFFVPEDREARASHKIDPDIFNPIPNSHTRYNPLWMRNFSKTVSMTVVVVSLSSYDKTKMMQQVQRRDKEVLLG